MSALSTLKVGWGAIRLHGLGILNAFLMNGKLPGYNPFCGQEHCSLPQEVVERIRGVGQLCEEPTTTPPVGRAEDLLSHLST